MRRNLVASFLLALVPALLLAQAKVVLEFPDEGTREVWFAADWPTSLPKTEKLDGKSFDVGAGSSQPTHKAFVWDRTTGNIAAKPLSEIRGVWKVAPADYKRIGQVTLRIEHGGDPVAAAQVNVTSKGYKREELVDPSSKGEIVLFAVPPGELEAKVKYKTADGSKTLTQKFPLELKRDTPEPVLAISIVDEVETVTPAKRDAATGGAESKGAKEEEGGGNIVSLIVSYLFALGLAAGVGYLIYNYVRKNKDQVQEKLQSLGVQLPDDNAAAAASAPPPAAPQPPQKIVLDDAAPITPIGTVDPYTPDPVIPIAPVGAPRLVGEDGRVFELQEGLFAVGREDGLPISLSGESTVSRRHAEITRSGDEVVLTDLGSTNGTYVNGQKVQADVTLRPGDTVQFGAVRFRYEA